MVARADGPGRIVLERADDVLGRYQEIFTGLFEDAEEGFDLEHLRNEWD